MNFRMEPAPWMGITGRFRSVETVEWPLLTGEGGMEAQTGRCANAGVRPAAAVLTDGSGTGALASARKAGAWRSRGGDGAGKETVALGHIHAVGHHSTPLPAMALKS